MDYSVFEKSFYPFGYRRKGNLFYKTKDAVLIIFGFEKICRGVEIRPLYSIVPFLSETEVDTRHPDGRELRFLNRFAGCLLADSYPIRFVSEKELEDHINAINGMLTENFLPYFENHSVSELIKTELEMEEVDTDISRWSAEDRVDIANKASAIFRLALLLIKYFGDFCGSLQWMEGLQKYKHTPLNDREEALLQAIRSEDKETILRLTEAAEKNFIRNNRKKFVLR